jgi:hypothetical protein
VYAAAVVLVLLSVALLVIWFAAEEHGRAVEENEERESRPAPGLKVPRFAPGEAAFLPLVVASMDAVRSYIPSVSCSCDHDAGSEPGRVRRIRYGGEVLYARVSRCPSCQSAATRYFRLLGPEPAPAE